MGTGLRYDSAGMADLVCSYISDFVIFIYSHSHH